MHCLSLSVSGGFAWAFHECTNSIVEWMDFTGRQIVGFVCAVCAVCASVLKHGQRQRHADIEKRIGTTSFAARVRRRRRRRKPASRLFRIL